MRHWLSSLKDRYLVNLHHAYASLFVARLVRRGGLVLGVSCLLLFAFFLLSLSGVPTFSRAQPGSPPLTLRAYSAVPETVTAEAISEAERIYGRSKEADLYARNLQAAYSETWDKDVLILFTSGGWGISSLEHSEDWQSLVTGMTEEMRSAGYRVVALNYRRTPENLSGKLNELREIVTGYFTKAKLLASQVSFLTRHNPRLKVILAGESTGTVICDSAMNLLRDNLQVFSIQTGVPFWHKNTTRERTLEITDNGLNKDAFSRGNLYPIFSTSLRSFLGIGSRSDEGTILGFLSSPGHEYWWQDPAVAAEITEFLSNNLAVQRRGLY